MSASISSVLNASIVPYKNDYDVLAKVILVGDSSVGKSAILKRFCEDTFSTSYSSTIGVDFEIINLDVDSYKCRLQIWDTAGQERFRSITTSYFRDSNAVLMVFDVTRRETFENLEDWADLVALHEQDNSSPMIIVGNKSDLKDQREVTQEEAIQYAKTLGVEYIECSAKDNSQIHKPFHDIAKLASIKSIDQIEKERKILGDDDDDDDEKDANKYHQSCCTIL